MTLVFGKGEKRPRAEIPLRWANRHGLITGPTGVGKTVTLMTLAERFAARGIPCFVPDVKGDIAALARSTPVKAYDLFARNGLPLRATIDAIGPELLARSLMLSDSQAGVLDVAAVIPPPMATLSDLRSKLAAMVANRREISATIGLVSPQSVGAIQRSLLRLERRGGSAFFGAPSFEIESLLLPGVISILEADSLILQPALYSTFLLWLLSELFERLPEVGDSDKPRLVFFFDEAHLLFADCPAPLLRRIEQVVRLVRSKGVGVYFVTQSPDDVPKVIAEQLAFRVDHLRRLGVGRAHFVGLDDTGKPLPWDLVKVDLPACRLGPLADDEREALLGPTLPAPILPPVTSASPWALATGAAAILGALGAAILLGLAPVALAILGGLAIACRRWALGLAGLALAIALRAL